MSSGETKRPNSGGDRQQKYKEKNKTAVEINQLKQNIKRAKLKETDPDKAETVRLENNKRKAVQRKREKKRKKENCNISAAENNDSDTALKSKSRKQEKNGARASGSNLSDVTLASDDGIFAVPTPSRQYILGVQLRGKNKKENIDKMNQIEEENESLRKTQDKHDDEIIELEFKVKDYEHIEENNMRKIEELEEKINTNTDEWFLLLDKNLTSHGKREI